MAETKKEKQQKQPSAFKVKCGNFFKKVHQHRYLVWFVSFLTFAILGIILFGIYGQVFFQPLPDMTTNPDSYYSMDWWRLYFLMSVLAFCYSWYFLYKLIKSKKNNQPKKDK